MNLDSTDNMSEMVATAQTGDRRAVERLVSAIQPNIYKICQRFLFIPADADDATQDILLKVITHLSKFDGRSQFFTWVYRVATNYLLDLKKGRSIHNMTMDEFGDDLAIGLNDRCDDGPHREKLYAEIRVGCTLALLHCLKPDFRMSYILGEILELEHQEAADVLQISMQTYRKRLSRARNQLSDFMEKHCGLINAKNRCRCSKRVSKATELGRLDPDNLIFSTSYQAAKDFPEVLAEIRSLENTRKVAALYRAQQQPEANDQFIHWLRDTLARQENRLHNLN